MNVILRYHPLPLALYFAGIILFSGFSEHPVLLLTSFLGSICYTASVTERRRFFKRLLFYLFLIALVTVTNPVFSHDGVKVLFYLQNNPVTLEAILCGFFLGIRVSSVLAWCDAGGKVFTSDKITYLLSRASERFSLLFSMTLRFIPLYARRAKEIRETQVSLGTYRANGIVRKAQIRSAVFSSMISRCLEEAVQTSSFMKAKGYGKKKRTVYHSFIFDKNDGVFLFLTLIAGGSVLASAVAGWTSFSFYPRMTPIDPDSRLSLAILSFILYAFLPILFEITETIKWMRYKSKI